MTEELNEVPRETPNFATQAASQLAEFFPEIVADGKINLDTLKTILDVDVEDGHERFGLTWPGKREAIRAAQTPTTATLMPDKENSVNWDTTQNVFIEGDNLEVLKVLQKHYYGQIKMIYIDPPYNTGKDFVYSDDYADPIGTYLERTEQRDAGGKLSTNTEADGRFHSNWLNMIYPRLKLARNLLSDEGVLFVSIDNGEVAGLRAALNEVFGENNFLCDLIWVKKEKASGVPPKSMVIPNYEHILVYSRVESGFSFRGQERSLASYKQDADGRYWRTMPIQATGAQNNWFVIVNPENGNDHHGNWAFSQSTIIQMIEDGKIKFPKSPSGKPEQIVYADELANQTSPIFANIGKFDSEVSTRRLNALIGGKLFDFPKPVDLIKFLIMQSTGNDNIVLDFFAGSGTTAHAVMALNAEDGGNRRCISVQLPEPTDEKSEARKAGYANIAEITRERIRRAGAKVLEEESAKLGGRAEGLDVGFRAYKLVDTNFTKWRAHSSLSEEELKGLFAGMGESADDDARPEALLTEVLLKLGFSLTEQVERVDVAGLEAFSVAGGLVVAYLNEHVKPTLEQLRAMVALEPGRLVVLEDAFQGDDVLKTNLVQECRSHGVDLWTA